MLRPTYTKTSLDQLANLRVIDIVPLEEVNRGDYIYNPQAKCWQYVHSISRVCGSFSNGDTVYMLGVKALGAEDHPSYSSQMKQLFVKAYVLNSETISMLTQLLHNTWNLTW